jgi:hypothetical protein
MGELIRLVVTRQGFDDVFSIEDWFNFGDLTNLELYNYMLHFVVDEKGQPVSEVEARKLFKGTKKAEWTQYVADFRKAIQDGFVPKESGSS